MVKEVVAYLANDGKMYDSFKDAQLADYRADLGENVQIFLLDQGKDPTHAHSKGIENAILRWEVWKSEHLNPASVADVAQVGPLTVEQPAAPQTTKIVEKVAAEYKHRIVIVGLLNDQGGIIEGEFGRFFNLRFIGADSGSAKFQDLKDAHKVILMSNFISHKHQDMVRSKGIQPLICAGGMSSLRNDLRKLKDALIPASH